MFFPFDSNTITSELMKFLRACKPSNYTHTELELTLALQVGSRRSWAGRHWLSGLGVHTPAVASGGVALHRSKVSVILALGDVDPYGGVILEEAQDSPPEGAADRPSDLAPNAELPATV